MRPQTSPPEGLIAFKELTVDEQRARQIYTAVVSLTTDELTTEQLVVANMYGHAGTSIDTIRDLNPELYPLIAPLFTQPDGTMHEEIVWVLDSITNARIAGDSVRYTR